MELGELEDWLPVEPVALSYMFSLSASLRCTLSNKGGEVNLRPNLKSQEDVCLPNKAMAPLLCVIGA